MARVTAEVRIAAGIDRVFDAFADIPTWADNVQAIQRIEMLSEGPVGVGTRFKETRVMFKKEATEEMEVTSFERPSQFTLEADSCGSHYVTVHRFTSDGDGTKVAVEFDATPVKFMAKLLSPLSALMIKSCAKMFVRDMEDVRAILEGNARPDDGEAEARVASEPA